MAHLSQLPSKRIIASYVFDWVWIIAIVAIGGGLKYSGTYHRPFSLTDLSISYPYVKSQIPTWLLVVVAMIAPAAIVLFVCLVFVPGRAASKVTPKKLIWRRKLWEINTGWMGLALSLGLSFVFTQGMKNAFGKPRPDLLDRCKPDIANYKNYIVANYATTTGFDAPWVLVSSEICTTTDTNLLKDGFRSFPSGHASFSWAGLFYLALFLCSKFAIAIPFVANRDTTDSTDSRVLPSYRQESTTSWNLTTIPPRNRAAAPPVYLLLLPLVPICSAIYITATRYFQYHHHGFDLLFGSFIGIATSWLAFRWYHMPISRGAGWSWGARSRERAFAIGVGMGGYVGSEGWSSAVKVAGDLENIEDGTRLDDLSGPGVEGPLESSRSEEGPKDGEEGGDTRFVERKQNVYVYI